MTKVILVIMLGMAAGAALAQDSAATTAAKAAEEKPFTPPPGFKTKKRGELTVYCIKDSTVGTRFKTERCLSEDQVRDYLIVQQENKRDMDRIRSTCSTAAVCAPP